MDNGASSYRRFLDGDDKGIAEIVGDYKDGLILYLNGYFKLNLLPLVKAIDIGMVQDEIDE